MVKKELRGRKSCSNKHHRIIFIREQEKQTKRRDVKHVGRYVVSNNFLSVLIIFFVFSFSFSLSLQHSWGKQQNRLADAIKTWFHLLSLSHLDDDAAQIKFQLHGQLSLIENKKSREKSFAYKSINLVKVQ